VNKRTETTYQIVLSAPVGVRLGLQFNELTVRVDHDTQHYSVIFWADGEEERTYYGHDFGMAMKELALIGSSAVWDDPSRRRELGELVADLRKEFGGNAQNASPGSEPTG
jgi:hypothetical protein